MAMACSAPQQAQKSTWQSLICVPAAPSVPASSDFTAWLEAWLRHERLTMEERHRNILSQIGGIIGSESLPAFNGTSAKATPVWMEPAGASAGIGEKSFVELSKRMQFSNEQAMVLATELRSTRNEVGALRATIETGMSLAQPYTGPFPQAAILQQWSPEAGVAPVAVQPAAEEPKKPEVQHKPEEPAPTRRPYNSTALAAFNSAKTSDLLDEADRNTPYMRFVRFVEHEYFDVFFGALILLSATALALELQYDAFDIGLEISFPGYDRQKQDVWPWAYDAFLWMERVFTGLFALELVFRFLAMRHLCFLDKWMYLDTFVVTFSVLALFGEHPIGLPVMLLRCLRVGRMVRILRIVRYIRFFDSLYLMMRSLQASFSALLWAFLILALMQMVTGMLLCQFIDEWIKNNHDQAVNRTLFTYFGSFSRSMLTMFEIMMANWASPARMLVNNISENWTLFFLCYRCMMGFALLSVIRAVFIHETMKVASTDDELAVFLAQRETEIYAAKVKEAFMELDDSGDGYVNWQELSQIMQDDVMKNWLKSMQIDVTQVRNLFLVLDDGDGRISADEFLRGIQKVKGNAKSIDVVMLLKLLHNVDKKLDRIRHQQLE